MADRYDIDRERDRERYDRDRFGGRDYDRERREPSGEREHWTEGRRDWGRDWNREGNRGENRPEWSREGNWDEGRCEWGQGAREWERERGHERRWDEPRYYARGEREHEREDWYDPRHRRDFDARRWTGRDWSREGTWGGPRDFMQGNDFNRPSYFGAGASGFGTTWGGYGGGSGSYSGGMGSYGERGHYAGRGPKGWQRSDERIREDVNERLTQHPDVDATEIEVQVNSCEVTLTGSVDNRDMKRIAEDVAESVSGVKEVHNQLRVSPAQVSTGGSRPGGQGGTNIRS